MIAEASHAVLEEAVTCSASCAQLSDPTTDGSIRIADGNHGDCDRIHSQRFRRSWTPLVEPGRLHSVASIPGGVVNVDRVGPREEHDELLRCARYRRSLSPPPRHSSIRRLLTIAHRFGGGPGMQSNRAGSRTWHSAGIWYVSFSVLRKLGSLWPFPPKAASSGRLNCLA